MIDYISWTIFTDQTLKKVRSRAERHGEEARLFKDIFRKEKGSALEAGDIILDCSIDKIGGVDE